MSLGIRQERPTATRSLLFANILLSVDEHSVVQAAQLEELLLYVGAELVEVVHVVLAAVSCNRNVVLQVYPLQRSVRSESDRIFIRTRVAALDGWNLKGHACVARVSRRRLFWRVRTCVCPRPKKPGILF